MGVGFTLKAITTEQFATFPSYLDINQEAQVGHSFQFALNPREQQVKVSASFDFKQHQRGIMKITVSCHFGIGDAAWEDFIQGNEVHLPQEFATNLFVLTVSTTRGILAAKTEHTPFSKFILPLLDAQQVIQSDIVFVY